MDGLPAVDPRAVALAAFRVLPNGEGREYTATTFPCDPWQGCERMIRMAREVGFVTASKAVDGYAVLDVLDKDGDVIQDYAIPTARAFQWFKRKLHWVVVPEEGAD